MLHTWCRADSGHHYSEASDREGHRQHRLLCPGLLEEKSLGPLGLGGDKGAKGCVFFKAQCKYFHTICLSLGLVPPVQFCLGPTSPESLIYRLLSCDTGEGESGAWTEEAIALC